MSDKAFHLLDDFPPVSREQWLEVVEKDLKGVPFEKRLVTRTYEGINLQPLYARQDCPGEKDPAGFPGFAPFTRGASPLGGAQNGWDICQSHAHPSPAETNAAILADLQRGANSVLLRLDAAARAGKDEEGCCCCCDSTAPDGVLIRTLGQLAETLKGVQLDAAGVQLEAGAASTAAAALLAAFWAKNGVAPAKALGAFNADPLGELAATGKLPVSVETALAQMAALAVWTDKNYPKSTAVRVSVQPYHEAGAHAVQELAFAIATGVQYLRALTAAGLSAEAACRQIVFTFSLSDDFFLEIAKLRAARALWGKVTAACGVANGGAPLRIHAVTGARMMTRRDPWVNMLRTTVAGFAAAAAGADSLTTEPFDAACGLPDDFSRRIARNTQVVLMEEAHLNQVVDPAGGAWYVEKRTAELAKLAWALFQEVEKQGGMAAAITSGWVATQVEEVWTARRKNLAKRKDPITGVSEFPNIHEEKVVRAQPALDALKAAAKSAVEQSRKQAADAVAKLTPASPLADLVSAATAGASICDLSKALWNGQTPAAAKALTPHRLSEDYETLRDATDAWLDAKGKRPQVFLANMGPVSHHTARAGYSKNFFEAAGFEVLSNKGFKEAAEAAEACKASGAAIAVICSSDALYPETVPAVAPALKAAGAATIVLAGNPGANEAAWREAGVDTFIFMGCDVLETLRSLLRNQGVIA
jgi:methylmalonyl-CoA mutase